MGGKYDIIIQYDAAGRQVIFDGLRRKWLVLTPEEWVRQNFVKSLIEIYGYPASRIANEVSLDLNGVRRRCDSIVYDNNLKPWLVVEYKEEGINISQTVFDQIARYNSVLKAKYLIVTNGRVTYVCKYNGSRQDYSFIKSIPSWRDLESDN